MFNIFGSLRKIVFFLCLFFVSINFISIYTHASDIDYNNIYQINESKDNLFLCNLNEISQEVQCWFFDFTTNPIIYNLYKFNWTTSEDYSSIKIIEYQNNFYFKLKNNFYKSSFSNKSLMNLWTDLSSLNPEIQTVFINYFNWNDLSNSIYNTYNIKNNSIFDNWFKILKNIELSTWNVQKAIFSNNNYYYCIENVCYKKDSNSKTYKSNINLSKNYTNPYYIPIKFQTNDKLFIYNETDNFDSNTFSWTIITFTNNQIDETNILENSILTDSILDWINIYKKLWNYVIYTKQNSLYSYNLSTWISILLSNDFKQIWNDSESQTELIYINSTNKVRKVWFDGTQNVLFNSNMNQNCAYDWSYWLQNFLVQNDTDNIYCSSEKQSYISINETSQGCKNQPQYCHLNYWYIFKINKITGTIQEIPLTFDLWTSTLVLAQLSSVMSYTYGNKVTLYNGYYYFLDWRYSNDNSYSGWNSRLYKIKRDWTEKWSVAYWETLQQFYWMYNNEFYMKSQAIWGQNFKENNTFSNRNRNINPPTELLNNLSISEINELNDSIKPSQSDKYNFVLISEWNCLTWWVNDFEGRYCNQFQYWVKIKAIAKSDNSETIIYNNSQTEIWVFDYCWNWDLNCIYKSSNWQPIWNWWISNLFYYNKFLYLMKSWSLHNIKIFN